MGRNFNLIFFKKHIFLTIILVIVFALIVCNYYGELEKYDKVTDMLNSFDAMFPSVEQMYSENIEVINRVNQIILKLEKQKIKFKAYKERGEVYIKLEQSHGEITIGPFKSCELITDSEKKDIEYLLTNKSYSVNFYYIDNTGFYVDWSGHSGGIFELQLYQGDVKPLSYSESVVKKIDNMSLPNNWNAAIYGNQYIFAETARNIAKGQVPIRPFFMPRMKPKPHRNA